MTVVVEGGVVRLTGRCLAEDAETLLQALSGNPDLIVDVSGAQKLHLAVVQILRASRSEITGASDHPFLAQHVFKKLLL